MRNVLFTDLDILMTYQINNNLKDSSENNSDKEKKLHKQDDLFEKLLCDELNTFA